MRADVQRVVDEWSGPGLTFADEPSLAARFEAIATTMPDRIALSYDGRTLTYAELNGRANQLAHFLRAAGVGPESLVGLFLERGVDLLVGLLGIVKSGGAYVPLDLAYPRDRLTFIAEDACASIVLSSASASGTLDQGSTRVVKLDHDWPRISEHPDTNPSNVTHAGSLAYVIYTSGSTGKPKGCQVTHGNVVRLFEATHAWFEFSADDVWTMFHSHAFDFSVWEIWGAWLYGGRLVVVPQLISRSPSQFLELLSRERVTFLNQTPSAFKQLTAAVAQRADHVPLALRRVVFGGEALELESLRPWVSVYGDAAPQLINMYGITETTVHVTYRRIRTADIEAGLGSVIGVPIPDLRVYVLDEQKRPCETGVTGELYVGGAGVSHGYLRRDDLTAQRFISWTPPGHVKAQRLYRSGDLARWLPDGGLEYLGRIDLQVKIRGFRIELGEIESVLARCDGVTMCAVVARSDRGSEPRLIGYIVPGTRAPSHGTIREFVKTQLPEYMVPSAFVMLRELPITTNGKLDHQALPAPEQSRPELSTEYAAPINAIEVACCDAYAALLQLDRVGRDDNFFELGGDSLLAVQTAEAIEQTIERRVGVAALFTNATPASLAAALAVVAKGTGPDTHASMPSAKDKPADDPIALIALAGRLPGAETTEEFWANLLSERDVVTVFGPEELDASVPAELSADSAYIRARTVLSNPESFDPAFFGLSQREGEILDPQQRLLLELSWEVLERAGYAPDRLAQAGVAVGVFAGVYSSEYLRKHVYSNADLVSRVGEFAAMLSTEKDFVATRIAHRLNLTGPAISVHTACSTALVAIAQAFDSLRAGRCDMAIAGGAAMTYPPRSGYLYQDGAMLSKDGVTRTFDASATGTVFGDGGAVVLMKRLADAIADGDQIYAVIRGAALNNDGGKKASFTAPSADGQAKVIAAAHRDAAVDARSISYVEAHGTATPIGDPVEIEGLTNAFRNGPRGTSDTGFCRIGSAKSNVGHIVAASGAVGVIKTALALTHEMIPATMHFDTPNPKIDFAASPFVVNSRLTAWPRGSAPRRAGVSAFGVGGTNAHVVLEEAPLRAPSTVVAGVHVLRLSARTPTALANAAQALAAHLRTDRDANMADVAFTLRDGRTAFAHRMTVIARDAIGAADALEQNDHALRAAKKVARHPHAIVLMFPGQGAQYPAMGSELYESEPVFRHACDEVFSALEGLTDFKLKAAMFTEPGASLIATAVTQPATFCLEYALTRLWQSRGIVPAVMIGHSVGEFVAAAIAGVMSLADAARLVARRGQLMNALPLGSMLSVRLSATQLRERLPATLALAAENGPTACVVAGPADDVAVFSALLERDGILSRLLQTSHAFHSAMMDPVLVPFEAEVRAIALSAPSIPIISTLSGARLTAAEAMDPSYWARHLRQTVRFSAAVQTVLSGEPALFLEVGPRHTLCTLVRQHASSWPDERVPATVPSLTDGPISEQAAFALAIGQLWLNGIEADRPIDNLRHRVRLPTYPFERVRCWVDAAPAVTTADRTASNISASEGSASGVPTAPALVTAQRAAVAGLGSGVPTPAPSVMSFAPAANRRATLITRLRTVFDDVGGVDLDDADPTMSFVELGLDSLVLTQAAIQVKKTFAVAITFRQLMEEHRSLDALAGFLDNKLPADAVPVPIVAPAPVTVAAEVAVAVAVATPQSVSAPAMSPAPATGFVRTVQPVRAMDTASASFAQQVIQQQLAIMEQQLALLGSAPPGIAVLPQSIAFPAAAAVPAAVAEAPMVSAVTTPTVSDEEAALAHKQYDVKKAFGAIARIHTNRNTELTDRQKQRLTAFMRSYVARTKASKAYTEAHRPHLADPRVVNGFRPQTKEICYQIVINKSKGSHMWDLDGNEYIDVLSGFGMNLFGWQPEFVSDAVKKQLDEGHDIGPQHPLAGEVADLICELTGFDRAGLCNTGSEAVMGAVRIARTVTGRDLIVIFTGSYHGIFDEVLVRGTRKLRAIPAAPGILQAAVENVLVLDYGTPESLEIIRSRAHELAAVLVEPVQSRRPDFQPVDFLREVRKITEESETVLIFDEVITGFRSHPRGAQGLFGITADLASYGKVIGGGYPVGVIAGKRQYMDALDGGAWQFGDDSIPSVGVTYFAGTFVRHPLALAACKAVLTHLKEEGALLQASLSASTTAMAAEMNAFVRKVGAPLEIRYFASLWRVTWLEDHPLQDLLWAMMRNRGIHVLDNFPCFMTTAHTAADIATIIRVFREALTEMVASGFLPGNVEEQVATADSSQPPVPNARLGRDRDGSPAWFVPDPRAPGQYLKLMA